MAPIWRPPTAAAAHAFSKLLTILQSEMGAHAGPVGGPGFSLGVGSGGFPSSRGAGLSGRSSVELRSKLNDLVSAWNGSPYLALGFTWPAELRARIQAERWAVEQASASQQHVHLQQPLTPGPVAPSSASFRHLYGSGVSDSSASSGDGDAMMGSRGSGVGGSAPAASVGLGAGAGARISSGVVGSYGSVATPLLQQQQQQHAPRPGSAPGGSGGIRWDQLSGLIKSRVGIGASATVAAAAAPSPTVVTPSPTASTVRGSSPVQLGGGCGMATEEGGCGDADSLLGVEHSDHEDDEGEEEGEEQAADPVELMPCLPDASWSPAYTLQMRLGGLNATVEASAALEALLAQRAAQAQAPPAASPFTSLGVHSGSSLSLYAGGPTSVPSPPGCAGFPLSTAAGSAAMGSGGAPVITGTALPTAVVHRLDTRCGGGELHNVSGVRSPLGAAGHYLHNASATAAAASSGGDHEMGCGRGASQPSAFQAFGQGTTAAAYGSGGSQPPVPLPTPTQANPHAGTPGVFGAGGYVMPQLVHATAHAGHTPFGNARGW